jgi:hypothetical protein
MRNGNYLNEREQQQQKTIADDQSSKNSKLIFSNFQLKE